MLSEVWPMAIPLWKRDGTIRAYALVDANDYEAVARYRWRGIAQANGRVRPVRERDGKTIFLYRDLLGLGPGDPEVDHRNGDSLDNRRMNLRPATSGQNKQNRQGATRDSKSGVRGVSWYKAGQKWRAQTQLNGRNHHLGYFDTVAEAEAVCIAFRRAHMPYSDMDKEK